MSLSRRNQEKLQLQQLAQANGGVILKNIFGIYASHPWLSILFVIFFALLTSTLYELLVSLFGESTIELGMIIWLVTILALFLVLIFLVVWRMHYGSIKPKPIVEKKVLITLVSAHRTDIKETASYQVLDAVLYGDSGQPNRNLLDEVIFIATEDQSTQTITKKLIEYVTDDINRIGTVHTIDVNDKYPNEIKKQLTLIIEDVLQRYNAGDILLDYTGGTKNMSIALHSLAQENFITAVYLYSAMDDRQSVIR